MATAAGHEPDGRHDQLNPLAKDHGASAVEYAILAALIAIAIVVAVTALGVSVRDVFTDPELINGLTP